MGTISPPSPPLGMKRTAGFPPSVPDMSLRALIFDVDGTLADTEQAGHRVAFVDPGDCLAVEGSGPGLAAARAAGVPTVVTPSAQVSDDVFSGALARYTDLSGLCLDDLRTLHAGTAGTDQT